MIWWQRLKASRFVHDAGAAVSASIVSLLISLVSTLIIPRALGVEEFGYWQSYLLYSSFAGLMHLGWNDGILLRYAGTTYESLDHSSLRQQFIMMVALEGLLGVILVGFVTIAGDGGRLQGILVAVVVAGGISCLRFMLLYVLLASRRVTDYALLIGSERVLFLLLALALISIDASAWSVVWADMIAKSVALTIAAIMCKGIVFTSGELLPLPWREVRQNISSGGKLLLSSLVSMLVLGVGRIGVERRWGIAAFSVVSLALSLTNLTLGVLNSVSGVVFTHLAKSSRRQLSRVFFRVDYLVTALLSLGLLMFQPLRMVVLLWLPEYQQSIPHLLILLPVVFFQGRSVLLLEPLLKAVRKEHVVLGANMAGLAVSLVVAALGVFVFDSVFLTVSSLTAGTAARSIVSEFVIRVSDRKPKWLDFLAQIAGIVFFLVVNVATPPAIAFALWLAVVLLVSALAWRSAGARLASGESHPMDSNSES